MMRQYRSDREWSVPDEAARSRARSSSQRTFLDGWQLAGVFLLFSLLSPALVAGTCRDWAEGLGLTLLSSPLLAWLLIPLRPSDDLFR